MKTLALLVVLAFSAQAQSLATSIGVSALLDVDSLGSLACALKRGIIYTAVAVRLLNAADKLQTRQILLEHLRRLTITDYLA
jgi:hypothetical protein